MQLFRSDWDRVSQALALCCRRGDTVQVQALLEAKANPRYKDDMGCLPIHEACVSGHWKERRAVTYISHTHTHRSLKALSPQLASLLLENGSPIDRRDGSGESPLTLASG